MLEIKRRFLSGFPFGVKLEALAISEKTVVFSLIPELRFRFNFTRCSHDVSR